MSSRPLNPFPNCRCLSHTAIAFEQPSYFGFLIVAIRFPLASCLIGIETDGLSCLPGLRHITVETTDKEEIDQHRIRQTGREIPLTQQMLILFSHISVHIGQGIHLHPLFRFIKRGGVQLDQLGHSAQDVLGNIGTANRKAREPAPTAIGLLLILQPLHPSLFPRS